MTTEQDFYILEIDKVNDDILEWCYKTFGTEGPRRDRTTRWFKVNKTFYFSSEKDLLWFQLKWP